MIASVILSFFFLCMLFGKFSSAFRTRSIAGIGLLAVVHIGILLVLFYTMTPPTAGH